MSAINAPNTTSVRKCPPAATRNALIAAVKTAAPAIAAARQCGGASMEGPNIQAAAAASPDANEQLFWQVPLRSHQWT